MEEDYLGTDYKAAEKKLKDAIEKCADKCEPKLRALLRRDMGMVHITTGKKDQGAKDFVEGLGIDPSIKLDKDLKTKDIEAAWNDALKKVGIQPEVGGTGPAVCDFAHTVPTEHKVRTPLPIFVEYSGTETFARVLVKYKGYGMQEFKPLEMKKLKDGWGVETPCNDVQEGPFKYYIVGQDANTDNIATCGDRNHTFIVDIKPDVVSTLSLPGRDPPKTCGENTDEGCPADAPPGFPGCEKEDGIACKEAKECKSEFCSKEKVCAAKPKTKGMICEHASECESGLCAKEKSTDADMICGAKPSQPRKLWVGLELMYDFNVVPGASDACATSVTTQNTMMFGAIGAGQTFNSVYYCTPENMIPGHPSGAGDYPASPTEAANLVDPVKMLPNGKAGNVGGGLSGGNFRIAASVDYLLPRLAPVDIMVGARLGLYIPAYPGNSSPPGSSGGNSFNWGASNSNAIIPFLHLELRATAFYPNAAATISGYGYTGFGFTTFEGHQSGIAVIPNGSSAVNCERTPTSSQCVTAWAFGGPLFFPLGGGVRYLITERIAVMAGARVHFAIGNPTFFFGFAPELAAQYGF
jgi:hypothetical protein